MGVAQQRRVRRGPPFDLGRSPCPDIFGGTRAPLIVGPIGGGEKSPRLLRDGFTFKATEGIRDLSNATITANPLIHGGLADASVDTRHAPATAPLDATEVDDIPGSQRQCGHRSIVP